MAVRCHDVWCDEALCHSWRRAGWQMLVDMPKAYAEIDMKVVGHVSVVNALPGEVQRLDSPVCGAAVKP